MHCPKLKIPVFSNSTKKKTSTGNDIESIHSFFYFCQEGRLEWQGPVSQQSFNHPIYTGILGDKKTCLVNNQCSLSFYPLFNTNSVQIKIELVAQRARGPGRGVEGVLGSVRQLRKNKQHKKAHSLCSKTTATLLFLITIYEALEGKHAIKTLSIT